MDLRVLRRGQQLAAGGAVLLFIFLFFFDWFGVGGQIGALAERFGVKATVNGWHGLTTLRWLMLITIILAIALALMAATRNSAASPVSLSAILTALAGLTTILVAYRLIINNPGPDKLIDTKVGSWLGLLSLVAITAGGYMSMKEEGVSFREAGGQARSAFDSVGRPDAGDGDSPEPPPPGTATSGQP